MRVYVGAGRAAGIRPGDLVGAIANEAGVPSRLIGAIEAEERFSWSMCRRKPPAKSSRPWGGRGSGDRKCRSESSGTETGRGIDGLQQEGSASACDEGTESVGVPFGKSCARRLACRESGFSSSNSPRLMLSAGWVEMVVSPVRSVLALVARQVLRYHSAQI